VRTCGAQPATCRGAPIGVVSSVISHSSIRRRPFNSRPYRAPPRSSVNGPRSCRFGLLICLRRVVFFAQAEKARSVPTQPGDFSRDGRQAGVGLPRPIEPAGRDHELVDLALMLSDNDRADFQMPGRLGPWLRQRREKPAQRRIDPLAAALVVSSPPAALEITRG
jgi:hypothetical protein